MDYGSIWSGETRDVCTADLTMPVCLVYLRYVLLGTNERGLKDILRSKFKLNVDRLMNHTTECGR